MAESSNGIPPVTGTCFVPGDYGADCESVDPCDSSAIVIQPEQLGSEDSHKELKAEYVDAEQEFYSSNTSVTNGLIDIQPQLGLDDTGPCVQHGFIHIKPQIGVETSNEEEFVEVCSVRPGRRNSRKRKQAEYVPLKAEPLPVVSHPSDYIRGLEVVCNKETEFKHDIKTAISSDSVQSSSSCPISPKKLKFLKESDGHMETHNGPKMVFNKDTELKQEIKSEISFGPGLPVPNANSCPDSPKKFKFPNESCAFLTTRDDGKKLFVCEVCWEYFPSIPLRYKHMKKVHPKAKLKKCNLCGKGFKKRILLVRHMKQHREDDERRHQCDVCGTKFKSEEYVAYHKAQKHGAPLPRECEERFLTALELSTHHSEKHLIRKYSSNAERGFHLQQRVFTGHPAKCQYCPLSYKKKSRLVRHVYYAHKREPKSLKCSLCDSRFKLQREKVLHMARKHGGPMPYICRKCGVGFTSIGKIVKHIENKHASPGEGENETLDGPSFELNSDFKQNHEFSDEREDGNTRNTFRETEKAIDKSCIAQEESHICSDCGAAFNTKLRLMTHPCKWPGHVTPQICPICLEGFRFQHEYDDHMQNHSVDDECICLMCPERFKCCLLRNSHMRSAHLQEDFEQCLYCSRTFTQRKLVVWHEKSHIVNLAVFKYKRRFEHRCKICRDRFESATRLRYHVLTVHGRVSLFACEMCKENFSSKQDLNAHVKNAHQDYQEVESSNSETESETSNSAMGNETSNSETESETSNSAMGNETSNSAMENEISKFVIENETSNSAMENEISNSGTLNETSNSAMENETANSAMENETPNSGTLNETLNTSVQLETDNAISQGSLVNVAANLLVDWKMQLHLI